MNCFNICFKKKVIKNTEEISTKINDEKLQVISEVNKLF